MPDRKNSSTAVDHFVWQLIADVQRLREGLRRIQEQSYDAAYTLETFAEAVLSGREP